MRSFIGSLGSYCVSLGTDFARRFCATGVGDIWVVNVTDMSLPFAVMSLAVVVNGVYAVDAIPDPDVTFEVGAMYGSSLGCPVVPHDCPASCDMFCHVLRIPAVRYRTIAGWKTWYCVCALNTFRHGNGPHVGA